MAKTNKGLIFILNNNDFKDGGRRKGSRNDVNNIQHVFSEIGYTPVVEENLSAKVKICLCAIYKCKPNKNV